MKSFERYLFSLLLSSLRRVAGTGEVRAGRASACLSHGNQSSSTKRQGARTFFRKNWL